MSSSPSSLRWPLSRCSARARSMCSWLTTPRASSNWPSCVLFSSSTWLIPYLNIQRPARRSRETLHRLRQFRVAVEFILRPRDLQDLLAVLVERGEPELRLVAPAVIANPEQQLQSLAVDESDVAHVENDA